jgi:predicted metal-dependent peptidase
MTDDRADNLATKLSAARTRLILDKPFLGALVLRLPTKAADSKWCPTTATDARCFYYNPGYIEALSLHQTEFVLAHEALHCALSHFARRLHRVKFRWDVACDYAINPLLMKEGFEQPPGTLWDPSFDGMTAEEIYPYIDENTAEEPMDRHIYDSQEGGGSGAEPHSTEQKEPQTEDASGGSGTEREQTGAEAEFNPSAGGTPQPPPLSEGERESLALQWQQRLAAAAQQAMQAGKLGGEMARLVDHLLQPRLPWRMLLAHYIRAAGRDDFSYTRPSRREGAAILPSLRSAAIDVVVAVDSSGSISEQELGEFLGEIDAIKGQMRARITVLACDAELAEGSPWVFEPWEECHFSAPIQGGGGTRFSPVFDWVSECDRSPDLLIYFTDGVGEFPAGPPSYPVLWLVKGKRSVPWGQRVQLN